METLEQYENGGGTPWGVIGGSQETPKKTPKTPFFTPFLGGSILGPLFWPFWAFFEEWPKSDKMPKSRDLTPKVRKVKK